MSDDVLRVPTLRDRPSEPELTLGLRPVVYTAVWFFIVAFHALCGGFLICVAMTYWFLTTGSMPSYSSIWSLRGIQNYHLYGFMFGLVGAMHGVRVLYILYVSICTRKLTFRSEARYRRTQHSLRIAKFVPNIFNQLVSRRGFFGVENQHFTTVFVVHGVLEIGSQTYQAYRASYLMPHASLNAWIVGLLLVNCWLTAGIQYFLRTSTALKRVLTLVADALISFCIMIVVPLVIFVPYMAGFDIKREIFKDQQSLHDPVFLTNLVLDNRMIFVSGLLDLGTKIIPQLGILLSLVTVSELIKWTETKVVPVSKSRSMSGPPQPWDVKEDIDTKVDKQSPPDTAPHGFLGALYKKRHASVILLFVSWGLAILVLHGLAAHRAAHYETQGCRAVTRPWFHNGKEPCSSLVINCYDRGIATPDEAVFDKLDLNTLSTLAIAHCPALRMPTSLQRLSSLLVLNLYNSTIVAWNSESAVTDTAQPRLLSILIGKTQMATFPPGLLEPLPATLISIYFSETNLTKIPDDLYKRWHPMVVVSFEDGILAELPDQMFSMNVYSLSFKGNKLETIPTLSMMPPGKIIPELRLEGNPLKELPETLMATDAFIMSINLEDTGVTTLPEWAKTNTKVVWGYETPLCETSISNPPAAPLVVCFPRSPLQEATFPTSLFNRLYKINE